MCMRFSMLKLQQLNCDLNTLLNLEILILLPKRNQSKKSAYKQNAQSFNVCIGELKLPLGAFECCYYQMEKFQTELLITNRVGYFFPFRQKFGKIFLHFPPEQKCHNDNSLFETEITTFEFVRFGF